MPASLRLRFAVAAAVFAYWTWWFLHEPSGLARDLDVACHLALLVGLCARNATARWLGFGVAAWNVAFDAHAVLAVPSILVRPLVINAIALLALGPWSRRDWTLRAAGLACLGFAWFPLMLHGHGAALLVQPVVPFAAGIALLAIDRLAHRRRAFAV